VLVRLLNRTQPILRLQRLRRPLQHQTLPPHLPSLYPMI
jgi:hypothetical protein